MYRQGYEYYWRTHAHPGSTFKYTMSSLLDLMRWDATDQIELIDQPLLMIAGSKADSLYMTGDAFAKATGTKDKDYNIIWFTEACLSNVLRLETYIQDAERAGDTELAEFFRRAQGESRKGAEQGKKLLKSRLK